MKSFFRAIILFQYLFEQEFVYHLFGFILLFIVSLLLYLHLLHLQRYYLDKYIDAIVSPAKAAEKRGESDMFFFHIFSENLLHKFHFILGKYNSCLPRVSSLITDHSIKRSLKIQPLHLEN